MVSVVVFTKLSLSKQGIVVQAAAAEPSPLKRVGYSGYSFANFELVEQPAPCSGLLSVNKRAIATSMHANKNGSLIFIALDLPIEIRTYFRYPAEMKIAPIVSKVVGRAAKRDMISTKRAGATMGKKLPAN